MDLRMNGSGKLPVLFRYAGWRGEGIMRNGQIVLFFAAGVFALLFSSCARLGRGVSGGGRGVTPCLDTGFDFDI